MGLFDKIKKTLKSDNKAESRDSSSIEKPDDVFENIDALSSSNESAKNFTYLDSLLNSGAKEIVLDSDITLSDDEASRYSDGIKLNTDGLLIDGNGHFIDACGKAGIFFSHSKKVTIKNITLKNGYSALGSAISAVKSEVSISNSKFISNKAKLKGGAIRNARGNMKIKESSFISNMANRGGGAICNDEASLTIDESSFKGNSAEQSGGAIYNTVACMTISKSEFRGNTAVDEGGAIYNHIRELNIKDSTIKGNRANKAGAIYNSYGGEVTISDSIFSSNDANEDAGVMVNTEGSLKIFKSEISDSQSANNIILNKDSLEIHETNFNGNKSKCIIFNEEESKLGIFYGEFAQNDIGESVICLNGKSSVIENVAFGDHLSNGSLNILNNSDLTLSNPKISDNGKTILNEKDLLLKNSSADVLEKIYGNGSLEVSGQFADGGKPEGDLAIGEGISTQLPGGEGISGQAVDQEIYDFSYLDRIIHETSSNEIVLDKDISFENYEKDFYEGGIELDRDNLIIDGNGRTINGRDKSRIFIITGDNIRLKNINFKNGRSHKNYSNALNNDGGAIRINHGLNLTVENCNFIDNSSEVNGGAISKHDGQLDIIGSSLMGNVAKNNGGALNNEKGNVKIMNSSFEENSSSEYGGALNNEEGKVEILESRWAKNTGCDGGAIRNSRGNLKASKSVFNENSAEEEAGAIRNEEGNVELLNSTLTGNTAIYGGAVVNCWDGGIFNISGSTLELNKADREGGAIHNDKGKILIRESEINKNMSKGGGAIRNYEGDLSIFDSTIEKNMAVVDGGAINNYNHKSCNLEGCKLNGNRPNDMNIRETFNFD